MDGWGRAADCSRGPEGSDSQRGGCHATSFSRVEKRDTLVVPRDVYLTVSRLSSFLLYLWNVVTAHLAARLRSEYGGLSSYIRFT